MQIMGLTDDIFNLSALYLKKNFNIKARQNKGKKRYYEKV